MQPTELCRYLCVALTIPLGIPYVLTLFGEWRLPATVVHRRLLLVMLCHCGLCALLYCTAGSGPTARLLLGTLPLALYWALFWAHTKYRDSRLLFTLITVTLLCTMTDMLCFLFLRYGSPYWLAVKLALCAAITLVLRVFVRRPFRAMLRSTDEGWTYVCLIPLSLLLCLLFCGTLPAVFGWALHARIITMLLGATALLIYFTWYRFFQLLRGQYRAEQDAAVLFTQILSLIHI